MLKLISGEHAGFELLRIEFCFVLFLKKSFISFRLEFTQGGGMGWWLTRVGQDFPGASEKIHTVLRFKQSKLRSEKNYKAQ